MRETTNGTWHRDIVRMILGDSGDESRMTASAATQDGFGQPVPRIIVFRILRLERWPSDVKTATARGRHTSVFS